MISKHIPNAITSLNLACGFISVAFSFNGDYKTAAFIILLAAVFDFLDGFAARLLKAYSDIGKELDSLADIVSFGVAPAFIVMLILEEICMNTGINDNFKWIAVLIPVFSALRLAKFNIDERQTSSFLGLPTPANAMFWAFGMAFGSSVFEETHVMAIVIMILVTVFSLLLVSEIPMFSLKFKNYALKSNFRQYLLIVLCIVFIITLGWTGIAATILAYILLSVLTYGK